MADIKGRTIAATYGKLLYTSTDDGLVGNTGSTTSVVTTDDMDGTSTASCLNLGIDRIGIGTTSPDASLHIVSAGEGSVADGGTNVAQLLVESTGTTAGSLGPTIALLNSSDGADNDYIGSISFLGDDDVGDSTGDTSISSTYGQIYCRILDATESSSPTVDGALFFAAPVNNTLTTHMYMAGGNVGIGTTTPGKKFEVVGNLLSRSTSSDSGDAIMMAHGTHGGSLWANTTYNPGGTDGDTHADNWTECITITGEAVGTPLVGIGNNTPATALEVTGEIICGSATASGGGGGFYCTKDAISGQFAGKFHITNDGGALHVLGASEDVDNIMYIHNSSNGWLGEVMLDMDTATAGATTEYFIHMETSDEDPEAYIRCDGTFAGHTNYGSDADYAEFFESKDGSALAPGSTVVLEGDKVRLAQDGESPMGVVRPANSSAVIGNSPLSWQGKFKKDDSGGLEWEDYEMFEIKSIDDDGQPVYTSYEVGKTDITPPSGTKIIKKKRRIISDQYNKDLEYSPREVRDEWNVIGLVGQVPIKKGQPIASSWIKMSEGSDSTDMYYIFPCAQVTK